MHLSLQVAILSVLPLAFCQATTPNTSRFATTTSAASNTESTTTVSLLFGNSEFAGSVITADATATTYLLSCAPSPSVSNPQCSLLGIAAPDQATVFQGPSTAGATATLSDGAMTLEVGCTLSGTVPTGCTVTATTGKLTFATPTDLSTLGKGLDPVRITAGLDKLKAAATAAASTGAGGNGGSGAGVGFGEAARLAALVAGMMGLGAGAVLL